MTARLPGVAALVTVVAGVGGLGGLGILGAGCGAAERIAVLSTRDPADYPCVLHDPHTLGRDFTVRQNLMIHTEHDGKPVDGQLEGIVQKRGDTLLIMGLGPMNVKTFTIEQRGERIEFHQFVGPELPFSPRNILVDVHRVFFKRLPPPAPEELHRVDGADAVQRGELDGETVVETWRDGSLHDAVFTRPGSALRGAIRVEFGPGCTTGACQPESAMLRNEWFGYTLAINNDGYEQL